MGPQKGLLGPKRALLGAPGVPIEVPEHMTSMLPTQLDQSVTVGTKLWPWGLLRTSRALRGPLGPPKGLFGPLGVLIWPQGGPKWHVIMCYTCGEWFKVIWGLSWQYLVRSSFYPSWHVSRTQKSQFWRREKFFMNIKAETFFIIIIGPKIIFCANFSQIGGYVFSKNGHLSIPIFGRFWPILAFFGPFLAPGTLNVPNWTIWVLKVPKFLEKFAP